MRALRRHLLHAVDKILAAPAPDEPHRKEAVSLKKLDKGDGSFSTRKVILGWTLDLVRQHLELTPHRKRVLASLFSDLTDCKQVSNKKWQRTLGQL